MTATTKVVPLILIAAALVWPPRPLPAAQSPELSNLREILRLRIVNDYQGEVSVSRDSGGSWHPLGRVLRYTTDTNRNGYTASKWVSPGRVAASAVNAIHMNVGYNAEDDRGVVVSLLPREFLTPPAAYNSFLSPDSSIYTDLLAGEAIFGGGEAPLVGSPVFREGPDGSLSALSEGYVPAKGDTLVIVVSVPVPYPISLVFENREGGAVTAVYEDGAPRHLGWVIRPVRGIGRFGGSLYAAAARIRAAHAGVIDVCSSPTGHLGAFQVIPVAHALSPEMGTAWSLTQWMIVGPAPGESVLWESLMPLFYQHIRPDYRPGDLTAADWKQRLLSRFLVEADFGNGWQPLSAPRLSPDLRVALPEWAHHALDGAARIRILFPLPPAGSAQSRPRPHSPWDME